MSNWKQKTLSCLPDCMMPDGADPCAGYHHLHSVAEQEIESLRVKLGTTRISHAKTTRERDALQQEIESLRSELKETVQAHADEERRGDELKRRAELIQAWLLTGSCQHMFNGETWGHEFIRQNPEAAQWFEEAE